MVLAGSFSSRRDSSTEFAGQVHVSGIKEILHDIAVDGCLQDGQRTGRHDGRPSLFAFQSTGNRVADLFERFFLRQALPVWGLRTLLGPAIFENSAHSALQFLQAPQRRGPFVLPKAYRFWHPALCTHWFLPDGHGGGFGVPDNTR